MLEKIVKRISEVGQKEEELKKELVNQLEELAESDDKRTTQEEDHFAVIVLFARNERTYIISKSPKEKESFFEIIGRNNEILPQTYDEPIKFCSYDNNFLKCIMMFDNSK